MKSQIELNIKNNKYEKDLELFKSDVIQLLNVAFELEQYEGVAERIFNKVYLENKNDELIIILHNVTELTIFFKENLQIILKTLMDQ